MKNREWKRKNDRWMYKETETYSSGKSYTNYYMQSTPSPNTEEGKSEGYYNSSTETEWDAKTDEEIKGWYNDQVTELEEMFGTPDEAPEFYTEIVEQKLVALQALIESDQSITGRKKWNLIIRLEELYGKHYVL